MLSNVLAAGLTSGITSAAQGGDPIKGAAMGALSSGLTNYAGPAIESGLQSIFGTFDPNINFADAMEGTKRAGGMLGDANVGGGAEGFDSFFGDSFPQVLSAAPAEGPLIGLSPTASQVPGMPVEGAWRGMLGVSSDPITGTPFDPTTGLATGSAVPPQFEGTMQSLLDAYGLPSPSTGGQPQFDLQQQPPPEPEQPTDAAPAQAEKKLSMLDKAAQIAKIGAVLSKLNAGNDVPEDAPQRAQDQSDADYSQALAGYIQVDAQALADMGLVPGTPEYYDYLMSQLDLTVADMTKGINVDAADLEQQLRGKTREELTALRRAIFVRGQLDQLMGSGAYTDPFTGKAENVITNGRQVQPGVAAYHRGLGRTIEDFARLTPIDRKQAIGGFLGRDADIYGMQARSDAQAEQAAQAQAFIEDLKRRKGMFSQSQQWQ